MNWYVIQSKPRKEQFLYERLRIVGLEAFCPYIRVKPANPRARRLRPYFPGYLFARVDLARTDRPFLQRMPGAVGLVMFGGEPAEVSEHLVNALRDHVEAINAGGRENPQLFRQGDAVMIRNGPFSGYEAIFDADLPGQRRAQVLLSFVQGYSMKLELPVEHIDAK